MWFATLSLRITIFSFFLAHKSWQFAVASSCTPIINWQNHQEFITHTIFPGLNCKINSVHRFLPLSSLALFFTETQNPSSNTTHFEFPNCTFCFSFVPKASVCVFVHQSTATCQETNLDFSVARVHLLGSPIPFLQLILMMHIPPVAVIPQNFDFPNPNAGHFYKS